MDQRTQANVQKSECCRNLDYPGTVQRLRESIHTKNILSNRPSADIYIAAKAKQLGATVVTAEEYKPHSAQLPNICEKLSVTYITFDDFMERVTQ